MRVTCEDLRCKYCGSSDIVKFGHFRGVQRWWCKTCNRKFADNDALPGMRTPSQQVAAAVNMYYEGMSLEAIGRHLEQMHRLDSSKSSVYRWVERFSKEGIEEAKRYKPKVGGVWVADETVLKIDGGKLWFWDIIDAKTRFLLASHISRTRTTNDARQLMMKAAKRAGRVPRAVITDKLAVYLDGIELAFGSDTRHIQSGPFDVVSGSNTNLIERFHSTLKSRTKVMRGIKRVETAKLFAEGWLLHYNFMRPHESLKKTPAEAAGIRTSFGSWKDIVERSEVPQPKAPTVIGREPTTQRMPRRGRMPRIRRAVRPAPTTLTRVR